MIFMSVYPLKERLLCSMVYFKRGAYWNRCLTIKKIEKVQRVSWPNERENFLAF